MPDITAIPIIKFLGWQITEDKQAVIVGFRAADGIEFNLELGEGPVKDAAVSLLDATGAFPKKTEDGQIWLIPTDWFEIGDTGTGKDFLRMRLEYGGILAFGLPTGMLANMRDVLVARLGPGSKPVISRAQH